MTAVAEYSICFGTNGEGPRHLDGGWAPPEPEFTWAVGDESRLSLPPVSGQPPRVLVLDLIPFVSPPHASSQRLIVSVNGTVVGASSIHRPTLLGYTIPPGLMEEGAPVEVTIQHPDAVRPVEVGVGQDSRQLSVAIVSAALFAWPPDSVAERLRFPPGLKIDGDGYGDRSLHGPGSLGPWLADRLSIGLDKLALRFESIGENCEFGLVQRSFDAEPLGLLRFSSTFLRNLIRGLDTEFAGIGEPDDIDPRLQGGPPREYMIHEAKFGLVYHSFVYEGQRSIWLMREQESARLKFLQRKFLEELKLAEKIFVYKREATAELDEILPLYLALRRHGPNTLLWVVPAPPNVTPGTVEVLMPGLLKGYIDRFAPDADAHDFSRDGWARVCTNALLLQSVCQAIL